MRLRYIYHCLCVAHLLLVPCALVDPTGPIGVAAPLSKLRENGRLVCSSLDIYYMGLYPIHVLAFVVLLHAWVHVHVIVVHDQIIVSKLIELDQ